MRVVSPFWWSVKNLNGAADSRAIEHIAMPSSRDSVLKDNSMPMHHGLVSVVTLFMESSLTSPLIGQVHMRSVPGRFYGHNSLRPRLVGVTTRARANSRNESTFEDVQVFLGTRLYIHDCLVTVIDATAQRHQFRIFFTRHAVQPPNLCLLKMPCPITWHGEMLVMRVSQANPSRVVKLRMGDASLSAKAIAR